MPRFTRVQSAHTYGVLDPHVIERRDTKFVDASLADGLNIIMLPQGGYTDRGGTDDYGRVRRQLVERTWTAGQATLPNGGSASGLLTGEAQLAGTVSGSRHVLAEIDFATATEVAFIDIGRVFAGTTGGAGALVAEYWTGSAWATFGTPLLLTNTNRTRRFGLDMASIIATRFRVCLDATAGASGVAGFSSVKFYGESSTLSSGRIGRYHYKAEDVHQLVLTDRNLDIFSDGAWVASVPIPAPMSIISDIKFEFGYDTILCFHQDMEPQKITRLGNAGEWSCAPIIFDNVPLVDYGGTYTNGVNERQEIQLYDIADGDRFQLICEGQTTTAITWAEGASSETIAGLIKSALEALPNVGSGLTVTGTLPVFLVEFTGADNEGRDWLLMSGIALNANGFVRVRLIQEGKAPGEPVMSASRGWPAVGRLIQKRLVMGGLKPKPNSIMASVTGAPFDLNTELGVATAAFLYDIGENEANVIRDLFLAKTLIVLGSVQHAWLKNNVLSADDIPEFGFSDAPGISRRIRPVATDNAIFYVQASGTSLRMMTYTEIEQNYVGDNASVLSAHLIDNPVDMTRRRSTDAIDSDLLVLVNTNGTATALTMMRTQEVSGYAPWRTDGLIRAVQTDQNDDLWLLVERDAGGTASLRLEKAVPEKQLDEAETRTIDPATDTITGLSRFEGRDVWAIAGGEVFGPITVESGQAVFSQPVSGSVRIGTWVAPFAKDPPIYLEQETGRRQARLKRVNRIGLSLIDTTSVAVSANGNDPVNLSLVNNDDLIMGQGPLDRPFTGSVVAEGMHGFTEDAQSIVTQTFPGALTVRRVSKDIVA